MGQDPTARDKHRDEAGTKSLKTLARKGFGRDKVLDTPGTTRSESCPTVTDDLGQVLPPAETPFVDFEERAAIIEYEAGVPRDWAEGFAGLDVAKPLPGFSRERWQQLIDDGGRFLDKWTAKAVELRWSAEDVFGVHPIAPAARYESMGLVPLIGGGEVIDIREDRATIRMSSGSCLTYYLRMPRADAIALWELREPIGKTEVVR